MKKRFTKEQIIQILKKQKAGERTADVCRRHGNWPTDVLQVEGEVRWHGSLRCSEAEVSGSREHSAKEASG